ncbi:Uncharacterized protein DAT39_000048 [Clarias magur]|uniref:Uncharacterized protein n=1 Tax=Clarias magur TaxID=1594786 RepID=A0A8J4XHG5_CLAMG|nr:Uncharacterized protein DAT39_000048 [Clarias magur]
MAYILYLWLVEIELKQKQRLTHLMMVDVEFRQEQRTGLNSRTTLGLETRATAGYLELYMDQKHTGLRMKAKKLDTETSSNFRMKKISLWTTGWQEVSTVWQE